MSSSKNIDLLKDNAPGVYVSEAQNPVPPPPYVYLFTRGGGGVRVEPERRGKGQQGGVQITRAG
jgi:hypothetical protein